MHILWVNEIPAFTGGCEQYVHETARLLANRGVRSTLLYSVDRPFDPAFLDPFDQAFPMVNLAEQVRAIKPDLVYIHRLNDISSVNALADSGVPSLRFIHDHRMFCPREHKYSLVGRKTCTKSVGLGCLACHGGLVADGGVRFVSPGAVLSEQAANRKLSAFVVASRYMADHIAEHGFPVVRTHINPLYAPRPEASAPVERERDLVLFVGQLGAQGKAVDTLIDAIARAPEPLRLRLLGRGKFEEAYRAQADRLGIGDRVEFAGQASRADLAREYRRCACVAFPSRSPETFGLVGPEAMSYGAPVVATNVGGIGEWLVNDETGYLVPSNDADALASALGAIWRDPARAAQMGAAGLRRWEVRFQPEHHVAALLDLFAVYAVKGLAA